MGHNIQELRSLSLMNQQHQAIRARYESQEISAEAYSNAIADLEDRWYAAVNSAYIAAGEFIQRDENDQPYVEIDGVWFYDEPAHLVQLLIQRGIMQDYFAEFVI